MHAEIYKDWQKLAFAKYFVRPARTASFKGLKAKV